MQRNPRSRPGLGLHPHPGKGRADATQTRRPHDPTDGLWVRKGGLAGSWLLQTEPEDAGRPWPQHLLSHLTRAPGGAATQRSQHKAPGPRAAASPPASGTLGPKTPMQNPDKDVKQGGGPPRGVCSNREAGNKPHKPSNCKADRPAAAENRGMGAVRTPCETRKSIQGCLGTRPLRSSLSL